jgi:hypothetical protein
MILAYQNAARRVKRIRLHFRAAAKIFAPRVHVMTIGKTLRAFHSSCARSHRDVP